MHNTMGSVISCIFRSWSGPCTRLYNRILTETQTTGCKGQKLVHLHVGLNKWTQLSDKICNLAQLQLVHNRVLFSHHSLIVILSRYQALCTAVKRVKPIGSWAPKPWHITCLYLSDIWLLNSLAANPLERLCSRVGKASFGPQGLDYRRIH